MPTVSALLKMQEKGDEVGYGAEGVCTQAVAAVSQGVNEPCQTQSSNPLGRPNRGVAPSRQGSNTPAVSPRENDFVIAGELLPQARRDCHTYFDL